MTDIPKEIMDEARRLSKLIILDSEPRKFLIEAFARALMARDQRAADIVRCYDPIFSATNSVLDDAADVILTYEDAG